MKKYLNKILEKPDRVRNNWALGMASLFSVLILISFAFYKDYLNFGSGDILTGDDKKTQMANVISSDAAPSPIENTTKTFEAAFKEIGKKYLEFKDSVSSVLVPFITGIEVYERK